MRGPTRFLLPNLGGLLLLLLLPGGCRPGETFTVSPPEPAPALVATQASGEEFRLDAQRGKVVLVSFGYTSCPDVCPTTLSHLKRLESRLGTAASELEVLFVSVDPERDEARKLEEYVHAFHPRFTGLRLEPEALAAVLAAWKVTATRHTLDRARYREHPLGEDVPYSIDHTGAYFLVDRRGLLRQRLPFGVGLERLREEVERLLAEEAPPGPRVEQAHARLTPAHVGAVYLTLLNGGPEEDRLLSAESPQAARVELHEVLAEGELLRMHPRPEGFVLPAHGRVELTPGGKHLMLYTTAASASRLVLTLRFEKAGPLSLSVPVVGPGADGP